MRTRTGPHGGWRRSGCTAAAMVMAACASAPDGDGDAQADLDTATVTLQSVRAEIDQAIVEARAESLSECRLIGLGERPCGGPRVYGAYSVAQTDSAYLAGLAVVYNQLDRERNQREGLVSTCEVVARPAVQLQSGRCVAGG